jgi:hypothetical protein
MFDGRVRVTPMPKSAQPDSAASWHAGFVELRREQTRSIKILKDIIKSSKKRLKLMKRQHHGPIYEKVRAEYTRAKIELHQMKQDRESNMMSYLFMLLEQNQILEQSILTPDTESASQIPDCL